MNRSKKSHRTYRPQGEVMMKLPNGWRYAESPHGFYGVICPTEGSWANIPMREGSEIARLLGWPNTCIKEIPAKILDRGWIDNGFVGFGCYVDFNGKPQKDISWAKIALQKHATLGVKEKE